MCSYGLSEELSGNSRKAAKQISRCEDWVDINYEYIDDDYDTYETIWQLYQYHSKVGNNDKASKYLKQAYAKINSNTLSRYMQMYSDKSHPRFFYSRDVIEAYNRGMSQ